MNTNRNEPLTVEGGFKGMLSPIKESEGGAFSALQLHFLRRLNRLLYLRVEQSEQVNEPGLHLIDRAIYSTYCDAVDLGVTAEAQKLLHRTARAAGRAGQD